MRAAIGYLGPILLALGAWLAAPDPHPVLSGALALGLVGLAGVLALVGVALGSQVTVGAGLVAGIAATLPPVVPMGWGGPALIVLGAALALEGAAARETGIPMAPLSAWRLPLGLTLAAALVSLAALATQVGRESLDISQGLGLAASAPFLLGAAWAGLRAFQRRRGDEGESPVAPALLAVVLLAGGIALATSAPAHAQSSEDCSGFDDQGGFVGCPVRLHVLAQPNDSAVVTNETYTLNRDRVLLIDPKPAFDETTNFTFSRATLNVDINPTTGDTSCTNRRFTLDRATGPWGRATTAEAAPDGTEPVTEAPTDGMCLGGGGTLGFNITTHMNAWADGEPIHGWRLRLTQGQPMDGGSGPYTMDGAYDRNAPEIVSITTRPAPQPTGDGGEILMAPVDGQISVDVDVDNPKGDLRNATLKVGDQEALNVTLPANDRANLTMDVTAGVANGSLLLRVQDWDDRFDRAFVASLRPDRTAPSMQPKPDSGLEDTDDGWRLPEPLPEGVDADVTFNVTDDACEFVDPCTRLVAVNETGATIANATGNATAHNITVPLPTQAPGDHVLTLRATDPAGRQATQKLAYRVSEPRAPVLTNVSITDGLGRSNRQEAGLPLVVNLTVEDESAPLTVNISSAGDELANRTVDVAGRSIELAPVVEQAGRRSLDIQVTDRWGNIASTVETVEMLPARNPRIELPEQRYLRSEDTLKASVFDASLAPENVTLRILRAGTPIAGATVDKALTDGGVDITIALPQLLHGEDVRIIATATDRLGQFSTASSDHEADVLAPDIRIDVTDGARIGATLWALPGGELNVTAEDPDSGLAHVTLRQPTERSLDPNGSTIPIDEVASRQLVIEAVDRVGNEANWTGQVELDEEAPRLSLSVDGHAVLATVREGQSGLAQVGITADGAPLSIPKVPGEHRVEIPDVARGDVVDVHLAAEDNVGHSANISRNVTIGDAPPELRVSSLEGRQLNLFTSDPDGDAVTTEARAVHLVNGSRRSISVAGNGTLTLPDWRGDVEVVVDAHAHNATTTRSRTFTLGEGPFLHASLPREVEPGSTVTVEVTWERAYEAVTLVVTQDGEQVTVANVTETSDGHGEATLSLDEEGSYGLELSGRHQDGTVETASVGQVDVESGPSGIFLAIGLLLLIAVVGLILLERYAEEDEEDAPPEGVDQR